MTSKGKAVSTILVSILIGVVAGILIDQTLLRGRLRLSSPPSRYENFKSRVFKDLKLNTDQQSELEHLLQRRQESFNEFRKNIDSQYIQLRETTRDSIRSLLTPDQREKFEGIVKGFDAERRREPRK